MALGLWEDSSSPFEDVFKADERGLLVTVLDSKGAILSQQMHCGIDASGLPPRSVVRMDFTKDRDGES